MKKVFGILIVGLFLVSMFGVVSAGVSGDIYNGLHSFYTELLTPLIKFFIGDTSGNVKGDLFFVQVLFLMIIFSVTWKALEKISFFEETSWVLWIVTISVSILSVRFLGDNNIVQAILLPYSTFGVALTAGIPFVLWFFVVESLGQQRKTIRRISWIFFVVIFVGLWFVRTQIANPSVKVDGFAAWIYLVTAALGLLMIIFDGTLQKFRTDLMIEKSGEQGKTEAITAIQVKLSGLADLLQQGIINSSELRRREKQYKKQIAALSR